MKILSFFLFLMITQQSEGQEIMKPILYGTAIGLVLIGYGILSWMYTLNDDRDPLIYSKFLSVRKNK